MLIIRKHNIFWLQVTVNNTGSLQRYQRPTHLPRVRFKLILTKTFESRLVDMSVNILVEQFKYDAVKPAKVKMLRHTHNTLQSLTVPYKSVQNPCLILRIFPLTCLIFGYFNRDSFAFPGQVQTLAHLAESPSVQHFLHEVPIRDRFAGRYFVLGVFACDLRFRVDADRAMRIQEREEGQFSKLELC